MGVCEFIALKLENLEYGVVAIGIASNTNETLLVVGNSVDFELDIYDIFEASQFDVNKKLLIKHNMILMIMKITWVDSSRGGRQLLWNEKGCEAETAGDWKIQVFLVFIFILLLIIENGKWINNLNEEKQ